MKTFLSTILLLALAILLIDCSNKGTEPGDELPKYENKLEFVVQFLTDSGRVDVPMDTLKPGIGPEIKVTIMHKLKTGSTIFVNLLNKNLDTIYSYQYRLRDSDTGHVFYFPRIRNIIDGIYYGNAYYVEDGVKHNIADNHFVVYTPTNKIVLFTKDIDGNEILKNSFRFGEIIFPKIVLLEPLTGNTKLHVYVADTNSQIVYSKVKNIGLLEDLEWYFSSLPKDLLGKYYISGYTDNEFVPRSRSGLEGMSFTITKE